MQNKIPSVGGASILSRTAQQKKNFAEMQVVIENIILPQVK